MSERRTEKKPEIDPGLLDELLKQYERHEEATRGLLERVCERILSGKMTR